MEFFTQTLDLQEVTGWFDFLNNNSVIYLILPFFAFEIIRYAVLKRLNWHIVGDSVANIVTVFAFIVIEYILGALLLFKLYFWVYQHLSIA